MKMKLEQDNSADAVRSNRTLPAWASLGLFLLVALLAVLLPSEPLLLGQDPVTYLESDWQVVLPDGSVQVTDLPAAIALPPDAAYSAHYTFRQAYPEGMVLRIRSSMQAVAIFLDGGCLFQSEKPRDSWIHVPEASVWYFVNLPSELQGKTLVLELSSPIPAFSGQINPVAIGSGDALLYDLLSSNWINLLIVLFLVVLGFLAILFAFLIRQVQDNRLLYLGLFAIFIALWLLSETRLMQFWVGNRFLIGSISYILIALVPASLLLYLRDTALVRHRRLLDVLAAVFAALCVVNLVLQLTGAVPLIRSAVVTNSLTLAAILLVIGLLVWEMRRHKSRTAGNFLLYVSVLIVSAVIEIVQFLGRHYDSTSSYGRIGIVIFFLFLTSDSVRTVNSLLEKEKEAQLLRQLAFRDALTGAGNRMAFERDVAKLTGPAGQAPFRLIMMDINNLKTINDRHGHQAGDAAIRTCHAAMTGAIGDKGACYRIGGDEFACLVSCTDPETCGQVTGQIRHNLSRDTAQLPYPLDLAIGSDIYKPGAYESVDAFMHHVDQLMYAQKREMKQES